MEKDVFCLYCLLWLLEVNNVYIFLISLDIEEEEMRKLLVLGLFILVLEISSVIAVDIVPTGTAAPYSQISVSFSTSDQLTLEKIFSGGVGKKIEIPKSGLYHFSMDISIQRHEAINKCRFKIDDINVQIGGRVLIDKIYTGADFICADELEKLAIDENGHIRAVEFNAYFEKGTYDLSIEINGKTKRDDASNKNNFFGIGIFGGQFYEILENEFTEDKDGDEAIGIKQEYIDYFPPLVRELYDYDDNDPSIKKKPVEKCDDKVDNDKNSLVDCAELSCDKEVCSDESICVNRLCMKNVYTYAEPINEGLFDEIEYLRPVKIPRGKTSEGKIPWNGDGCDADSDCDGTANYKGEKMECKSGVCCFPRQEAESDPVEGRIACQPEITNDIDMSIDGEITASVVLGRGKSFSRANGYYLVTRPRDKISCEAGFIGKVKKDGLAKEDIDKIKNGKLKLKFVLRDVENLKIISEGTRECEEIFSIGLPGFEGGGQDTKNNELIMTYPGCSYDFPIVGELDRGKKLICEVYPEGYQDMSIKLDEIVIARFIDYFVKVNQKGWGNAKAQWNKLEELSKINGNFANAGKPVFFNREVNVHIGKLINYEGKAEKGEDCEEIDLGGGGKSVEGRHDSISYILGVKDEKYLCFNGKIYGCGSEASRLDLASYVDDQRQIGSWLCHRTSKKIEEGGKWENIKLEICSVKKDSGKIVIDEIGRGSQRLDRFLGLSSFDSFILVSEDIMDKQVQCEESALESVAKFAAKPFEGVTTFISWPVIYAFERIGAIRPATKEVIGEKALPKTAAFLLNYFPGMMWRLSDKLPIVGEPIGEAKYYIFEWVPEVIHDEAYVGIFKQEILGLSREQYNAERLQKNFRQIVIRAGNDPDAGLTKARARSEGACYTETYSLYMNDFMKSFFKISPDERRSLMEGKGAPFAAAGIKFFDRTCVNQYPSCCFDSDFIKWSGSLQDSLEIVPSNPLPWIYAFVKWTGAGSLEIKEAEKCGTTNSCRGWPLKFVPGKEGAPPENPDYDPPYYASGTEKEIYVALDYLHDRGPFERTDFETKGLMSSDYLISLKDKYTELPDWMKKIAAEQLF